MISKNKIRLYIYIFINFKRFFKKFFLKISVDKSLLKKFAKKKNLFFKKKFRVKTLISRRLFILLKRRKLLSPRRIRKNYRGNFFFKKFFFKTLIRSRKFLKSFFFKTSKIRQKNLSKKILLNSQKKFLKNTTYEYNALNIVLRSNFCLFLADVIVFFKKNFFYLNGININNTSVVLQEYDCLQLKLSSSIYKYILFSKKILKKKTAIVRFNSWKFFKHKFFKKQEHLKPKKRKVPKYIYMFYLFKLNAPKFLEVDYFSLSIFILKKQSTFSTSSYYLNKLFSFKLFPIYNFKKIN